MNPREIENRIADIETRLSGIEAHLLRQASQAPAAVRPVPPAAARVGQAPVRTSPPAQPLKESQLIGNILGWGGAIALLLAASYLIRLAVDSGWLTPIRQLAFAAVFGLLLIGSGFALRRGNRDYAGLLPATGVAVLFLTIYGGHLYHHLIGAQEAGAAVIIVCAASLWLCRAFESDLFALFAVAGSYFAPFLLRGAVGSLTDVAIYYSAWGVVFSVFSIWHGRRLIYLLALYLALIGFDMLWRGRGGADQWLAVLAFQTAQFAIFGIATAVFSVRHSSPLDQRDALGHLPPLLLFYFLQYSLLVQHLPGLAPWIAVGSLAALAAIYGIARYTLQEPLPGGEFLLWCYTALVLFHAGYIETVPHAWGPWVGFILVPVVAVASIRDDDGFGSRWPIWVAIGIIFAVNYLRILFNADIHTVPAKQLLPVAYALLLYLAYWFCRQKDLLGGANMLLLAMGHICAMAAALRLLDVPIIESVAWGVLAIGCLGLSLYVKDRLLGQSSLAVFGATAVKVLLSDLSGASTIARIIGLVVIGATFYVGGMLYQRLLAKNE
ncbi:MAG: DUF2339 domain-containing protein [Nitrospirota bacterium]